MTDLSAGAYCAAMATTSGINATTALNASSSDSPIRPPSACNSVIARVTAGATNAPSATHHAGAG